MTQSDRPNDRAVAPAAALVIAVVVTGALVLILPAGHPARVVAGLLLFIALPGIGFRDAFVRPSAPLASWEGLALAGAIGLAVSSLASLLILALGLPLTPVSVAASCGTLSTLSALVSGTHRRAVLPGRPPIPGRWMLAAALGSVVLGAVVGSAAGTFEPREYFTVFALADPAAARSAMESVSNGSGEASVQVLVESHESGTESYGLLVAGTRYPEFTLRVSEALVIEVRIHPNSTGPIVIQLLKVGVPYRHLQLDIP